MTDKVQRILSEIASRKLCTMDEHMAFYNDKAKEDYRLFSEIEEVIKTLQEEPVSEELEKAAVEAFKHIVDSDKNNFLEIFKAGAEWKEEQIMKDAIDAKIGSFVDGTIYDVDFNIDSDLKQDDKVKVIIIKSK